MENDLFLQVLSIHFYFPQLNMNWNPSTSSFISDYELPISNLDGHKIDLMVPGVLEIQPRLSRR